MINDVAQQTAEQLHNPKAASRRNRVMRIALITIGGRGDTQPFVALAVRLRQEGHRVTLAARPDFADLAADYGVDFAPLGHPYKPFITGAAESSALGAGHLLKQVRYGLSQRRYFSEQINQDAWRAAQRAEAIIYKYSWITGYTIAEKLGIPCAAAMLFPLTSTKAFPSFLIGRGIDRGPLLNRVTWNLSEQVVWQLLHWEDAKLRRELGLRPLPFFGPLARQQREEMPVYYAYSPVVLPRPADWPERVQVTGYWFLEPPPGWQPPADLLDFLKGGLPPVSIGFGSMASRDADATLDLVLRALKLSGQRGVLLSGWADLGKGRVLPESVFRAESLPHSWLFPRMSAVVHHGGAGTTGAVLRSGVPSVITSLAADQPSWAQRIFALGAGPSPLSFRSLTAERLAEAVREATTNPTIRTRAGQLGKQIRAEDGVGRTMELIMRYVGREGRIGP
jgi:sterol 3beta-glucosyltransferase